MSINTEIETFNKNLLKGFQLVRINPIFFKEIEKEYVKKNKNINNDSLLSVKIIEKLKILSRLSYVDLKDYFSNERETIYFIAAHEVLIENLAKEVDELRKKMNKDDEWSEEVKDYCKTIYITLLNTVFNYPMMTEKSIIETSIKNKKQWLKEELAIVEKLTKQIR